MLPTTLIDTSSVEEILSGLDRQAANFSPGGLRAEPTQSAAPIVPARPPVAIEPPVLPTLQAPTKTKTPARRSAVVELLSDVSNNGEPVNYHIPLRIGKPPNAIHLQVGLDTGSTKFWVKALRPEDDKQTYSPNRPIYFPDDPEVDANMSTSRDLQSEDRIAYADGGEVSMEYYEDVVEAAGLISPNQDFGAVFVANYSNMSKFSANTDGMLGLGLQMPKLKTPRKVDDEDHPPRDNMIVSMKKKGILERAWCTLIGPWVSDRAYVSAGATTAGERLRGFAVLGAPDKNFYNGAITWCDSLHHQFGLGWVVKLDAVKINGVTVFKDQLALLDTGTSFVVVSPATQKALKALIPGSQDVVAQASSSAPRHNFKMFHHPINAVKTMTFVLGGKDWEMLDEDITLGDTKLEGQTNVVSSVMTMNGKWQLGRDNVWVIGGIFLDNYVTIFDFEKERVGFADISPDTFQDLDKKVPSYIEEQSADG